jgi:DNA polymerase-3 subunit epsilon
MRQIVLDTETTGLEISEGHRIIEIGCVELIDRKLTNRHYHVYLNPDREIDAGAIAVHGITNEFLADKPRFADIASDFLAFVDGAELIIHNAVFDLGFINHEMRLINDAASYLETRCGVVDTLVMAREKHPGQRNNLDALCKRYSIDNSGRELHGALLDAQILADLYLVMTGGQTALSLSGQTINGQPGKETTLVHIDGSGLKVIKATIEELANHETCLAEVEKVAGMRIWR